MKKTLLAFIALLFLVIATGCATETAATNEGRKTITVAHELGEVQVVKNPQNVVVLDFGMLDTMDKLGIQVTGIPKNNLPEYLSHFNTDEFSSVGGLRELDFEAIHALNPELIIISARQIEQYEELSDIAPTIFLGVDATDYMNSFKKNVHTLGKIFDQSDKIDESLTQIDETIAQIKEKAQGNSALVVLASEGSVSAFGPGSRF
ncbi:MAG: ABC transporter substrate-binding protein, partial [Streptococcaceae bacterium]|nr:ABC transporter substrate-binding protein [Streptococcaceae bacterium]